MPARAPVRELTRYGKPVAFVVAESFEQARAAAYLVEVKYRRDNGKYALQKQLDSARVPHPKDGAAADSEVGDFARLQVDVYVGCRRSTGLDWRDPVQPGLTLLCHLQTMASR
jgi:CO/xanthine dehydrogenase Mo-binding subunit